MIGASLLDHPFFRLSISTRSTLGEITEACESLTLDLDPSWLQQTRAALAQPRSRLALELRWLPGLAPARARDLVEHLRSQPQDVRQHLHQLPPLAKCNLIAALLVHGQIPLWDAVVLAAVEYARIDAASLMHTLNEDRAVARAPLLQEVSVVEDELHSRREEFADDLSRTLARQEAPGPLLTRIIEAFVDKGWTDLPFLLQGLIDRYQLAAQRSLDNHTTTIRDSLGTIRHNAKPGFTSRKELGAAIKRLEASLLQWDEAAQPIQLLMRSKGVSHAQSITLATDIRDVALELANGQGLHEEAMTLSSLVLKVFSEAPQVAEQTAEDIRVLENILARKRSAAELQERRRRELSLDFMIGHDRLRLTPDIIQYQGQSLTTDEVDRLRWGVFKNYVNGIRVNREFTVWAGTPANTIKIECVRLFESEETVAARMSQIVEKLWGLVGVRLTGEIIASLSAGKTVTVCGLRVTRGGIWLQKRRWLSSEPYFAEWTELKYYGAQGNLVLSSKKEPKATASLSYRDVDNAHILEAVLSFLWQDGNHIKLARGEFS
jgi:hypothetical protein